MLGPKSTSNVAKLVSHVVHCLTDNTMLLKCAAFLVLGIFLSYYLSFSCALTTGIVFAVYLLTGGLKFTWVVLNTLPRDIR